MMRRILALTLAVIALATTGAAPAAFARGGGGGEHFGGGVHFGGGAHFGGGVHPGGMHLGGNLGGTHFAPGMHVGPALGAGTRMHTSVAPGPADGRIFARRDLHRRFHGRIYGYDDVDCSLPYFAETYRWMCSLPQ
jgi:hypothetical protein